MGYERGSEMTAKRLGRIFKQRENMWKLDSLRKKILKRARLTTELGKLIVGHDYNPTEIKSGKFKDSENRSEARMHYLTIKLDTVHERIVEVAKLPKDAKNNGDSLKLLNEFIDKWLADHNYTEMLDGFLYFEKK